MTETPTLSLSELAPDIVLLTFDTPGRSANLLSRPTLEELRVHLDSLSARTDLAGLVITSAKPGVFIAGADLKEFMASLQAEKSQIVQLCRMGQELFRRLSQCPFVTVAAIDGLCLGGGAEMASWCDRRILTTEDKTEFGFPEVKLGLFPGWGGTVRLPRLIGLANAVEMITSGESLGWEACRALGLAEDACPREKLREAAVAMVRDEQATGRYRADRERRSAPVTLSETELGFLGVTASALIRQQTKGNYPAPETVLELMLETAPQDVEAALQREAEEMAKLFGSAVNAALLNVFFLTDRVKKDHGLERSDVTPASIGSVSVVGAGIMGAGIAAANLKRDLPVVLADASPEALAKGARNVLEEAAYDKKRRGLDPAQVLRMTPLLHQTSSDAEIARSDLIIEAIIEQPDAKQQLYRRLEPLLKESAILASNTSTISITRLAEKLQRADRFCGIHFFNPVRRMKLVEVIRGRQTSDETVATAVAYAKRIGKLPIVVRDSPGFLVNRLLFPYMLEAVELLSEGASIKEIDRAARAFGMPLGPFELYDMVGLDTSVYAGKIMWEAFPELVLTSPLLPAMIKAGRLGQKSGSGFYSYRNRKGRAEPDPTLEPLIDQYRRGKRKFSQEELTTRLFMPMVLEATRVLEGHIVRDPRDIDLGLIYGLGFPAFRGGLLFWADSVGADKLLEMIAPLESLGARMKPTQMLLEMAKNGKKFYQA